jgi:hypothetical protein
MNNKIHYLIFITALLFLAACGSKEAVVEVPTSAPTEVPVLQPGDPPAEAERTLEDSDASIKAEEKRVVSGDNYLNNLYERPFTSIDMEYQPDLNILTASIASDESFFYFTLTLDGADPVSGKLTGAYSIEFDRTQTGRGDLLVWVTDPTREWSMNGIKVYIDNSAVVGGLKPVAAEEGYQGKGYTETIALSGDEAAWARIDPDDPNAVQIAISRALIVSEEFIWGAWADGGIQDPSLFDYDDHFDQSEAGSAVKDDADYPIKALYSLDNTCRFSYGFETAGEVPGVCISGGSGNCYCAKYLRTFCVDWDCE